MTLIEAAQRLITMGPMEDEGFCTFCGKTEHEPACDWLAMPQIVAALEAAQAVVEIHDDLDKWEGQLDHDDKEWVAQKALKAALGDAPADISVVEHQVPSDYMRFTVGGERQRIPFYRAEAPRVVNSTTFEWGFTEDGG